MSTHSSDNRSPYVSPERYEHPKEDFKAVVAELQALTDPERSYKLADIGCANGELLYFLHQAFPHWELHGFDRNADFLETGRHFPGLRDVTLTQADLYDVQGEFDIVIATCLLSLFPEIEPPLDKLLSLCREGGHIVASGLFNEFDIDVRVQYYDHTAPEDEARWITDFNRHSQRRIRQHYENQVRRITFQPCTYNNVEIPHRPDNPARVWTFGESNGNTLLMNGAWQIANQTLMTIDK